MERHSLHGAAWPTRNLVGILGRDRRLDILTTHILAIIRATFPVPSN